MYKGLEKERQVSGPEGSVVGLGFRMWSEAWTGTGYELWDWVIE